MWVHIWNVSITSSWNLEIHLHAIQPFTHIFGHLFWSVNDDGQTATCGSSKIVCCHLCGLFLFLTELLPRREPELKFRRSFRRQCLEQLQDFWGKFSDIAPG